MTEHEKASGVWSLVDASDSESWALCSGANWVSQADAEHGAELAGVLQSLEYQVADLESEVARARSSGYSEGIDAGSEEVWRVIAQLELERHALTRRAAVVACELAAGLVGDAVSQDTAALERWASHALAADDLGRDVVGVEVAVPLKDAVAALLNPTAVVGAADLAPGDARVVMRSGKREFRLAEVFEGLQAAVLARLGTEE